MIRSTRLLLIGGIVAAPLFIGLWALQAFTRAGFRPTFHVAAVAVAVLGTPDTLAIRLVVSSAIELGFVAAIAASALFRPARRA